MVKKLEEKWSHYLRPDLSKLYKIGLFYWLILRHVLFTGARANKNSHREPESTSFCGLHGYHELLTSE